VFEAALYVTEQLPLERVQLAGNPLGPPLKVTVPDAFVEYMPSPFKTVTMQAVEPL
jgi:hypothetical protein